MPAQLMWSSRLHHAALQHSLVLLDLPHGAVVAQLTPSFFLLMFCTLVQGLFCSGIQCTDILEERVFYETRYLHLGRRHISFAFSLCCDPNYRFGYAD